MAEIRVNPTRMELKRLQVRYQTARRGHKLLKDKRDELMRRFLLVVRQDKELRERVEAALAPALTALATASATGDPRMLTEALLLPARECEIEVRERNNMSVIVPDFSWQTTSVRESESFIYGFASTSGDLDLALARLAAIREDMLAMAQLEKEAQLLAEEIERTRRRVNALEYIMMPQYLAAIKSIKMKLDENERGNTTRLMKVKDMMLREQLASRNDDEEEEVENA